MRSEDFFPEFYYADEIVPENEGIMKKVSLFRALCLPKATINNLITLFAGALL